MKLIFGQYISKPNKLRSVKVINAK